MAIYIQIVKQCETEHTVRYGFGPSGALVGQVSLNKQTGAVELLDS